MRTNSLKILCVLCVLFIAGQVYGDVDLTLYTETDPFSRLTVTADSISIVQLDANEQAWVYYDYGTDYSHPTAQC